MRDVLSLYLWRHIKPFLQNLRIAAFFFSAFLNSWQCETDRLPNLYRFPTQLKNKTKWNFRFRRT